MADLLSCPFPLRIGAPAPLAALLSLAALTGCAGAWDRSRERWYDHTTEAGPYSEWASCIDSRSRLHLDSGEYAEETHSQVFTRVLADCRPFMSGPAWQGTGNDPMQRLLADAWRAFFAIRIMIDGDRADSITLEVRH